MLLVPFLVLIGVAACEDVWRYRISNMLCVALLLLFLVAALPGAWPVHWISHVAAALIMFAVGLGIFAARLMGGGDIKLMVVVALWAGLSGLPHVLLAICWASLPVVLALLAVRAVPLHRFAALPRPRFAEPGAPVPFAVPIAIGVIASLRHFPAFAA